MSYNDLVLKVRQAEQALEARERTMAADWRQVKSSWKDAWTPGRIVGAGAIAGFMFGRKGGRRGAAESSGAGMVRLATSLIGLVGAVQAKTAAGEAQDAAESVGDTAAVAAGGAATATTATAAASARSDRRVPDPGWDAPPRAAEAATEISEP